MKQFVVAAVLVALLVPVAARADLDKGDFAPDIEAVDWLNTGGKSLSISEMRGMVVVLYFWESWDASGKKLLPWINRLENHPELGRQAGVYTIGVTSADRRTVEETIKKAHIFFPIALASKAASAYKIKEFPRIVIVDPTGAIAFSDSNNPAKDIEKLLEDSPPFRTHPREAEKARKLMQDSREALNRGDYRDAFLKAREADEHALMDDRLKVRCQEMMDLVDAIGRDRLQQGMMLIDNHQFEQGVQLVNEVIDQFQVTGCGKAARRHMRFLRDHYPEVQRAADKLGREDQARARLIEAAEKLWRRKFGEAYDALKKVEQEYADTKAAETAKTIRGRMDANQGLMQRVRDEQAKGACEDRLARARVFIEQKRYDEARKLLRSIIDEFPNTRYREDAYQLLSEMP